MISEITSFLSGGLLLFANSDAVFLLSFVVLVGFNFSIYKLEETKIKGDGE